MITPDDYTPVQRERIALIYRLAEELVANCAASGDWTEALRGVEVPTVVIHGSDDSLIDVSGGKATAAAIPGAELVQIDGMGHDLPKALWPRFVELIVANADRAGVGAGEAEGELLGG